MKRDFFRITLVLLCMLGISQYAKGDLGGGTKKYYAKLTATVSSTGGGKVYVSNDANASAPSSSSYGNSKNTSGTTEASGGTVQFKVFALPNTGYEFLGWGEQNNASNKSSENPWVTNMTAATSDGENNSTTKTIYATFRHPQAVSAVENPITLSELTEPAGVVNGTVKFNVTNTLSADELNASISGGGFEITNTGYSSNIVTISLKYTGQNKNGNQSGTVNLKGFDNSNPINITVNVPVNLTPKFNLTTSDCGEVETGDYKVTNITPSNRNTTAMNATWHAEISGTDASSFSLATSNPVGGVSSITFSPTEARNYSATLMLTATYIDATGAELTETKTCSLTGIGRHTELSYLRLNDQANLSYNFTTQAGVSTSQTFVISKQQVGDISVIETDPNDIYNYSISGDMLTITCSPSLPGTYSGASFTLRSSSIVGEGLKTATLNLSTNVNLTSPDLSLYSGHSQITLVWDEVIGANRYNIYRNGDLLKTINSGSTTQYTDEGLSTLTTYQYELRASRGGEYEQTSGIHQKKTSEISVVDAPYFGLRLKAPNPNADNNATLNYIDKTFDMTNCFSGSNTFFDKMFYFDDINSQCYVYLPIGGTKYVYTPSESFNPKSVAQKPDRTEYNGKKYYFAGCCKSAFCGASNETEGFFYFQGQNATTIDIYLDNCGLTVPSKARQVTQKSSLLGLDDEWHRGGSCVFAFQSSGTGSATSGTQMPLTARFHTCGANKLVGATGCSFSDPRGEEHTHPLSSAAIGIRPTSTTQTTTLNFDDVWIDGNRTNGKLSLNSTVTNASAIDIGNSKGVVNFDGGRYKLASTYYSGSGTGSYTSSLTISYRHYEFMTLECYGFGTDETAGVVNIYDGSFSTYGVSGVAITSGTYRSTYDLRLPQSSTINGGSFEGMAYICTELTGRGTNPKNKAGQELCQFEVEADMSTLHPNGTVELDMSNINGWDIFTDYNPYGAGNAGPKGQDSYGRESLTPSADGFLHIYLNAEVAEDDAEMCAMVTEENIVYWYSALPYVDAGVGSMGQKGAINTTIPEDNPAEKKGYFAVFELDKYVRENASMNIDGFGTLEVTCNYERSNVTNNNPYTFEYGVYYVKSFDSNKWYTFVPPFDIANIYVVEAGGSQRDGESREDFLARQGNANFDMATTVYTKICPDDISKSSPSTMIQILNATSNTNYHPKRLIPYDGTNADEAHFYLYEAANDGVWDKAANGENYNANWNFVTPSEPQNYQRLGELGPEPFTAPVLMQAPKLIDDGIDLSISHTKTYALNFPSSKSEDYWTGKYIIFEGYGPQTLFGRADQADFFLTPADVRAGKAQLGGNYTFANYTTDNELYRHNTSTNLFVKETGEKTIYPGEAFLMLHTGESMRIASVSREGVVRFNNTDEETTGLPTIADNKLLVFAEKGMINIQAFAQQQVSVYAANGVKIYCGEMNDGESKSVVATAGVYIIRSNEQTAKLIVP